MWDLPLLPAYMHILRRGLTLAAIILIFNAIVGFASTWLGFRVTDAIGDLLLLEVAALFIGAGIVDFSTSVGISQIRRLIFPGKEGFSSSSRRESEFRALVLVVTGLFLCVIMILLALLDMSILNL
jgi:hypothetical protein